MKRNTNKVQFKMFQHDGAFYNYTGKIFDLFAVSVFWLIGCIPIITFGASSSAMYAAISRSICRDQGTIWGEFRKAFARDFKTNLKLWLGMTVALFLLGLNLGIVHAKIQGMIGLFLLMVYGMCLFILVAMSCYLFPAVSRFNMPIGWFVKFSIYCVFRHLPSSIMIVAVTVVTYFLILRMPGLLLVLPGLSCYIKQFFISYILQKYEPKEENVE